MYIRCVIVSYNNGIIRYSYIPVQAVEERFCKMSGIPLDNWFSQSLPESVNRGLCDQCQCHMSVSDIYVGCAGPRPTEGLICIEKFFNMPATWVMKSQIVYFFTVSSYEKCFILILIGFFSAALSNLVQGHLKITVSWVIGAFMCGKASPSGNKLFVGDIFEFLFQRWLIG